MKCSATSSKNDSHIVGDSIPIKALRKQIALIAPNNSRVLIYGESGTGKELVARNIHFLSKRTTAPFVEVNCAAIPEELIESELFGHTKGSFTGASESKKGKFELADGGTLFLDEIGDMSLKTQAKVLRAVEEQVVPTYRRAAAVRVDVRVLAATNKNLAQRNCRRAISRGSLLSAERHSLPRPASPRDDGKTFPSCRATSCECLWSTDLRRRNSDRTCWI